MKGIGETISDILSGSDDIDAPRRDAIGRLVVERGRHIEQKSHGKPKKPASLM
jgi:hypothetical protein